MNRNFYSLKLLIAALCVMLYSNVQVQAQSCPSASRTLSNGKASTPNDAIGAVLKNLLKINGIDEGIDKAGWLFEPGGTFVENGDGTADLTAVLSQYPLPSNRKFQVQVRFINQTYTAPVGNPVLTNIASLNPSTQGWYYYDWGASTLTGIGDLAGAKLNLSMHMMAAQVGIGGSDQVPDVNILGGSAWFSWDIVSQPSNSGIVINPYPLNPSMDQGDLCFTLSGTPTVCPPPAPITGCIDFKAYNDLNRDNIFQATEPGISNLTISLVNPDFTPVVGFENKVVNANGEFRFDGVPTGNYFITIPLATITGDKILNEPQEARAVTVVAGSICSAAFAGYAAPATGSISGKAYCDDNNNGLDATDKPAKSVLVTLCDANGVQIGTPISTDDNGNYTFTNLPAGSYIVKFSPTAVMGTDTKPIITAPTISVTLTVGENRTGVNAGYYKPIDPCASDIQPPTFVKFCPTDISETTTADCKAITWVAPTATDNCGTPSVSSNFNSGFCFPIGTTTVTYTATDGKSNTTSCSFKVTIGKLLGCIGDQTYCDNNNNGIFDAGDAAATGLTVTLCDANFVTITTQTVDATGKYKFTNLAAGTYNVKFPTATIDGKPLTTTSPIKVVLAAGQNFLDADAGYYKAPEPVCNINFDPNKCYKIVNKGSGKVLDVSGSSSANDACIVQWASTGKPNQTWKFAALGSSYFKIISQNCNKVIACHATSNSAPVYQYDYYTGGYKDWKIECVAGGYYKITHKASGKVLDVSGASTADGAKLNIYPYSGNNNQLWQIVEVPCVAPTPVCIPKLTFNNKCNFSVNVFWDNNGTKVKHTTLSAGQSWSCNTTNGYKWIVCNATSGAQIATYTVSGCGEQICNASSSVSQNCNLTFYNKSGSSCSIYWINNLGQKVFYKTLSNNQSYSQSTFYGHKWIVCDNKGKTINDYTVNRYGNSWCNVYSNSCFWWFLNSAQIFTLEAQLSSGRTTLNWVNNTSYKNDFFTLQRINNTTGEFEDLKLLNNFTDSDELVSYTEYDDNPQDGDNYYRIKVVFGDGTISYTETKKVSLGDLSGIRLFPNPASDVLNIDLSEFKGQDVNIFLYNQFGQQVQFKNVQNATTAPVTLDIAPLKSGNFIIRVAAKGKRDITKQVTITK